MPRNGSGTYSLPQSPFQSGTVISSAAMNSDLSDIASALTGSLPRDGQAGMSGQLKLTDGSTVSPSITFTTDSTTGFSHGTSPTTVGVSIAGVSVGTFSSAGWTGAVGGQNTVQIGTVVDFAGSTAPAQWYLCFGQAISRTTFSSLFSVIGTTYGSGNGTTTFNLPDLRGTSIFGTDNMGGSAAGRLTTTYYGSDPTIIGDRGGAQNQTLSIAQLPTNIGSSGTFTCNVGNIVSANSQVTTFSCTGGGPQVWTAWPNGAIIIVNTTTLASGSVISSNTSGLPHTIVPPALVMNKMIFAGA